MTREKRHEAGRPKEDFIGWKEKVHVCGSQEEKERERKRDKWDWNLA